MPLVVRGAGTGYTGGAVPTHGGVVLSMERLNRILEIDEDNLLAVVEPDVITGDLQRAVERVGLFYPPDPASLEPSSIGGNVAECAGGPRAFKYGTTKRYVLALEAVLPTGEIVRTGSKAVKNVVGYDLTQLLVGSEGTLAIITEITLRLMPKPPARATLSASFATIRAACEAVTALIRRRVVPAAIELVDADSLHAVEAYVQRRAVAPAGTTRCSSSNATACRRPSRRRSVASTQACAAAGAIEITRAASEDERDELWAVAAAAVAGAARDRPAQDQPRRRGAARPGAGAVRRRSQAVQARVRLRIASFGHAGDGNIHVNLMVDRDGRGRAGAREAGRARRCSSASWRSRARSAASTASASPRRRTSASSSPPETIALMKRVKAAFDPHGILNPGKIFP